MQPDLIFVSKGRSEILVEEGIRGAPDLVVEILSASTAERDRTIKRKLYQRQDVAQYWMVDPDVESVDVWDFQASAEKPARYVEELAVRLGGRDWGEIRLPEIFTPEL